MLTNKSYKYKMKNEILFFHADMKLKIASIKKKIMHAFVYAYVFLSFHQLS